MLVKGKTLKNKIEEISSQSKEDNQGRFLKRYAISSGICYVSLGNVRVGHPLGSFEVREKDWDHLKEVYSNAGYEIKEQ